MADTVTYEPIATYTFPSNGTFTFSNISGAYTDLRIVCNIKSTAGGMSFNPNNTSSSIFSMTYLRGNGSAASSTRLSTADLGGTGYYLFNGAVSTTNFETVTIDLFNYSNTTTYKTVLVRFNNSTSWVGAAVGLAQTTSAITSLVFGFDGGGSYVSGSTITIYGIKAA